MNFRELKPIDYVIIVLVLLLLLLAGVVALGKNDILFKSPVKAEKKVAFQVFFRGITITNPNSPFQVGQDSFITIRNVPYTKLKIADVKFDRRKVVIPANNKQKFAVVDDASSPFQFDFLVTLLDNGKVTDDGIVVGGNKLKIGVPVVLEGPNYKLTGTLSDVEVIDPSKLAKRNQNAKSNIQTEMPKAESKSK